MRALNFHTQIAGALIGIAGLISSPAAQATPQPKELAFHKTGLYSQLIREWRQGPSPQEKSVSEAIEKLSRAYHAWNPTIPVDAIKESIKRDVQTKGLEKGLVNPALLIIDVAHFHGKREFAKPISAVLGTLNKDIGDVLHRELNLPASQAQLSDSPGDQIDFMDFEKAHRSYLEQNPSATHIATASSSSALTSAEQVEIAAVFFGKGSFDAEEGATLQTNETGESPIMGRNLLVAKVTEPQTFEPHVGLSPVVMAGSLPRSGFIRVASVMDGEGKGRYNGGDPGTWRAPSREFPEKPARTYDGTNPRTWTRESDAFRSEPAERPSRESSNDRSAVAPAQPSAQSQAPNQSKQGMSENKRRAYTCYLGCQVQGAITAAGITSSFPTVPGAIAGFVAGEVQATLCSLDCRDKARDKEKADREAQRQSNSLEDAPPPR